LRPCRAEVSQAQPTCPGRRLPALWYRLPGTDLYAIGGTASLLNPFIWDRPLDDPPKIVGMEAFAHQVALTLKGQTNVALFGPRDTGKTTFTNQLALELAKTHVRMRRRLTSSRSTCSGW
jgi:hypothetical protein